MPGVQWRQRQGRAEHPPHKLSLAHRPHALAWDSLRRRTLSSGWEVATPQDLLAEPLRCLCRSILQILDHSDCPSEFVHPSTNRISQPKLSELLCMNVHQEWPPQCAQCCKQLHQPSTGLSERTSPVAASFSRVDKAFPPKVCVTTASVSTWLSAADNIRPSTVVASAHGKMT